MQKAVCTSPLIRLYPIGSDAHEPIGNNWLFIINMEVAVMAYLFDLDLVKTSQEERIIKGKNGEADSKYYVVGLSNGCKSFDVTCGEKNNLVTIGVFQKCKVYFDIVDKKLKAVDAVSATGSVGKSSEKTGNV